MKTLLISAPMDNKYMVSSRTGNYPPLSLGSLAGYILSKHPNFNLKIIDGEMIDMDEINKERSDIVGIGCNILTYKNALNLAEYFSDIGSKVILGGPFPTSMAEEIIKNRPFIDAVVVGDGEETLFKIIAGYPKKQIPNLVYKEGSSIIRNNRIDLNLKKCTYSKLCKFRSFKILFKFFKKIC